MGVAVEHSMTIGATRRGDGKGIGADTGLYGSASGQLGHSHPVAITHDGVAEVRGDVLGFYFPVPGLFLLGMGIDVAIDAVGEGGIEVAGGGRRLGPEALCDFAMHEGALGDVGAEGGGSVDAAQFAASHEEE